MSLAGIAIAIGVLVDAGIVVTENAFRFLEQRKVDPADRRLVWATVLESTRLVGRPVFFSMAIILLAFVPVFALTGQEGKLFHPLAFTKTFAVLAATVIAVTLVPVLCTLAPWRTLPRRRGQSGDARAPAGISAGADGGARAPGAHGLHGRAAAWRARCSSPAASAASSCRRSTRAI